MTNEWTMFTKRTDGLKLAWLEKQLDDKGIEHRRNGDSFHAPILEVHESDLDAAWGVLTPVDEVDDDDTRCALDAVGEAHPHDLSE